MSTALNWSSCKRSFHVGQVSATERMAHSLVVSNLGSVEPKGSLWVYNGSALIQVTFVELKSADEQKTNMSGIHFLSCSYMLGSWRLVLCLSEYFGTRVRKLGNTCCWNFIDEQTSCEKSCPCKKLKTTRLRHHLSIIITDSPIIIFIEDAMQT